MLSEKSKQSVEIVLKSRQQLKRKEIIMLSQNIKKLRISRGMTQKELAEKLHVTPQAVSRWENGEVEPSVSTIGEMADIFGVTADEIIGGERTVKKETAATAVAGVGESAGEEVSKPAETVVHSFVYGVCQICGKPITDHGDLVKKTFSRRGRSSEKIYCKKCADMLSEHEKRERIAYAVRQRKRSFIWGGLIAALVTAIAVYFAAKYSNAGGIILSVIGGIATFTFVSCLFLKNNFIEDVFLGIAEWGAVKFPGLIFSFDLDGIAWLIGMKILFAILGFLIGFAVICLATVVCLTLSLFVYPFALNKSIHKPEETEV